MNENFIFSIGEKILLIKHDFSYWRTHTNVPLNSEGTIVNIHKNGELVIKFKSVVCMVMPNCIAPLMYNKSLIENIIDEI